MKDIRTRETDKDKQAMYDRQISAVENSLQTIVTVTDADARRKVNIARVCHVYRLPLK